MYRNGYHILLVLYPKKNSSSYLEVIIKECIGGVRTIGCVPVAHHSTWQSTPCYRNGIFRGMKT
jgi:hypothetical protein